MKVSDLFAFYGSLRMGMSNYKAYAPFLHYVETRRLHGFQLFALDDYPYAVKSADRFSIVVDLFRIPDEATRQRIHQLEVEAGYYLYPVAIDNRVAGIYLFEQIGNNQEVKSGDWVEFFGN